MIPEDCIYDIVISKKGKKLEIIRALSLKQLIIIKKVLGKNNISYIVYKDSVLVSAG